MEAVLILAAVIVGCVWFLRHRIGRVTFGITIETRDAEPPPKTEPPPIPPVKALPPPSRQIALPAPPTLKTTANSATRRKGGSDDPGLFDEC